jgi:anti-sigma B factor antagonist
MTTQPTPQTPLVIDAPVRLDAAVATSFRDILRSHIAEGQLFLAVNFAATQFIDSSGMASLVSALKAMRTAKGRLVLVGIHDAALEIFNLTRMDLIFEMSPSIEAIAI